MSSPEPPKPPSPVGNIPGYRPNEPANSPWNKQILAYHAARVPYTIETQEEKSSSLPSSSPSGMSSYSFGPSTQSQQAAQAGRQSSANEILPAPTSVKSTNPELESAIMGSFKNNTAAWAKGGQNFSNYLSSLSAKGILTDNDIQQLNAYANIFNAGVSKENAEIRKANFTNVNNNQAKMTSVLTAGKSAGLTSMNVLDSSGKVIGTVNPQNVGVAKLQATRLLLGVGGSGSIQGTVTKSNAISGINTNQKSLAFKNDPFSMFVRPVLSFGASIGEQILSDIKSGKPGGATGFQVLSGLFSGKPVSPTSSDVSTKLESTFGMNQEVQQITSGKLSAPQQIAAILGVAASVAIPTVAGMGGIGKVPEFETLSARVQGAKGVSVVKAVPKISKAFQERPLEVFSENIGLTKELSQGTELKITPTAFKYEKAPIQIQRVSSKVQTDILNLGGGKTVKVSEKIPSGSIVKATQPILPKGISLTRPISTVGPKGQEVIKEIPNVLTTTTKEAGEAKLPYAYISKSQTAFVRGEPSFLPEEKFIVSGKIKPEVISTLGLEPMKGVKETFISPPLTKGMKEYLGQAEKAGLITEPLSEIHLQSTEDILKTPESPFVYTEVSRNPELFKSKAFQQGGLLEEITRPQVIKYREAYPIKTQEFKAKDLTPRNFKPMKPFGSPVKPGKVGAGSAGKAASLMKEITKPEAKPITKPEIFRTEAKQEQGGFLFKPVITRQRNENIEEMEIISSSKFSLLNPPKSFNDVISRVNIGSKLREGFRTNQEKIRKQVTKPVVITVPISMVMPKLFTSTSEIITTKQVSQQVTVNTYPGKNPTPMFTPGEPSKRKIPGDFPFWLPNPIQGPGVPATGGGARKGFVGNVPEYQFTGMFNRPEVIYGHPRTSPKQSKAMKEITSEKGFVFNKISGSKSGKATRKSLSTKYIKLI